MSVSVRATLATSPEDGRRFVSRLIAGILLLLVLYVAAHIPQYDGDEQLRTNLVQVDSIGVAAFPDPQGIRWWVGARADDAIEGMTSRNEGIRQGRARVFRLLESLVVVTPRYPAGGYDHGGIRTADRRTRPHLIRYGSDLWPLALSGDYSGLAQELALLEGSGLAPSTLTNTPSLARVIDNLQSEVSRLEGLKAQQLGALVGLGPPTFSRMFFWATPTLSIVEVLFFALFGVLTNLLVNSAEFLRKGEFRPAERWVAYTKLVYGPVLAVILTIAMVMGWFDAGGYPVRVYTLPLLGFVFGYASRRVVTLFDEIVGRILGSVGTSVREGPEAIALERREYLDTTRVTQPASSIDDLRRKAKELTYEYLKTGAIELEARS